MKLRKDDKVVVLAGKDKGREGAILKVIPATASVIVEGMNIAKKHVKPGGKNPRGGIIELTRPMRAGKVALICPNCRKPTRIGYDMKGDTKERICRKCQKVVK